MRKHPVKSSFSTYSPVWVSARVGVWIFCWLLFSLFSFSANAQCTVSCNGSVSLSLNANGEAVVTPEILLNDPDCDPNDFTVSISVNGSNIGNTLTCAHIGELAVATAIQTATGNSCWSYVQVHDYLPPQISCTDTIIPCNAASVPDSIGYPVATDNCAVFTNNDFTFQDDVTDLPCGTQHNGIPVASRVERLWSVSDGNGGTDTCTQTIYLQRATLSDVVFPLHRDGLSAPHLDCSQNPGDTDLTGVPTVFGQPIENGSTCNLSVSFSDAQLPACGTASFNIMRTWTVTDWCAATFTNHLQVIKVMDETNPQINCPADLTVGASVISCDATVLLPTATATDDCSNVSVSSFWAFGTGGGPFYNVPVGTHLVTYTAVDDCGNASTCSINVVVEDDVAPVNICETAIAINISSGGSATVPAITFDDGSFDNCQIDHFEVKRGGMPFGPFVTFDCNDVENGPVMITFRVFDSVGNYNDCMVAVTIFDNIPPVIDCGAPVVVDCTDDVYNTNITGMPTYADNCGIDSLFYTDVDNTGTCGTGTISRTWTVIDRSGHSSTCVQTIVVEDNTPVQISFPPDFTTSECSASPDSLDAGEPVVINDDCESVSITYTEDIFNIAPPACYTILRHWVVVDWCTYVPNSGSTAGYWEHTQIISVTDDEPPELTAPTSFTAASLAPDCGTDYIEVDSAFAVDCNPHVVITNDSPYADANGPDASGSYPIGVYNITFTANDDCGNVSTSNMVLTVVDGLAPTAICLSGLALTLGADGTAVLDPELLNYGSYDNCTDTSNMVLIASPNSFDCGDLGMQPVTLTVKDEAGNQSSCTTMVEVQDNLLACGQQYDLSGQVLTWKGEAMEGLEMQLIQADTNKVYTDADGNFLYNEALSEEAYVVKPWKNEGFVNGVSTWDLVLMSKHILELNELDNPYKIIAADVNRSGSISTFDMVHLRKLILFIDTEFSNNTSWRFVDADFVFPDEGNPFSTTFPESIFLESVVEDLSDLDFVGIKIGDVNGSADPNGLWSGADRDANDNLTFEMEDRYFLRGEVIDVPFQLAAPLPLLGYQFTIQLDTNLLDLEEIIPGDDLAESPVGADDFGWRFSEAGYITTSWINAHEEELLSSTEFFRLRCRAKGQGRISEGVEVHSEITRAEAYVDSKSGELEWMGVTCRFLEPPPDPVPGLVLSNWPNPFREYTILSVENPVSSAVQLSVYDAMGRLCMQEELYLKKGTHRFKWMAEELGGGLAGGGTYICQLTNTATRQTVNHKMVAVR